MRFYTNVQMVGDNFLVRGYVDGKHFTTREKFYPTLFVSSKKRSKYKTLTGDLVEKLDDKKSIQVTLTPWILLTSDTEIVIPGNQVLTIVEPITSVKEMYSEKVNGSDGAGTDK